MTRAWAIDWERPASDRVDLAHRVLDALHHHPDVEQAELFGSLASLEPDGYPTDELSDIDVRVTVNRGSDRDFFDAVEPIATVDRAEQSAGHRSQRVGIGSMREGGGEDALRWSRRVAGREENRAGGADWQREYLQSSGIQRATGAKSVASRGRSRP